MVSHMLFLSTRNPIMTKIATNIVSKAINTINAVTKSFSSFYM